MKIAAKIGFLLMAAAWGCVAAGSADDRDQLDVLRIRPNFYVIAGAGGNIGVQIGNQGVVLVDAGTKEASRAVLAEIRKLTDQPIRYIINSGPDADHVGGNGEVSKAGQTIFPLGNNARAEMTKAMTGGGASIFAHEGVLTRMSAPVGTAGAFPSEGWPTETYYQKRKYIYFNHEGIEILHPPAAHSDADSEIFFRISDVVMAGDVLDTMHFPVIDLARGGSVQGEIDALNKLIELAIPPGPFPFESGGTYVVPGHGRICDQADVVEYRDMVVIVRDVIQDMITRGMTLDQIKAASPAGPYQQQYGSDSGPWTTNAFIEAIYKSLAAKK